MRRELVVVAGPRPQLGAWRQACPDGVERQVAAQLTEVSVGLDGHGHEAVADRVAAAAVTGVESPDVHGIEALHASGERLGCTHEQVPMRVHQAVGQDIPSVQLGRLAEQAENHVAIDRIEEHGLMVVAVYGNMLKSTMIIDP